MTEQHSHFRSHEEEVWNKLSEAVGGTFVEGEIAWQDKVHIKDGPWTITLDHHYHYGARSEIKFTRFRAPYINTDGFRFSLHRQNLLDSIVTIFGMQDVKIGDDELDRMFVVEANNPQEVRKLLGSAAIREHLKLEPNVSLRVRDSGDWFQDDYPDGVDELVLCVEDEVEELDRLKRLYRLFAETLHRLCDIGSAYERGPGLNP